MYSLTKIVVTVVYLSCAVAEAKDEVLDVDTTEALKGVTEVAEAEVEARLATAASVMPVSDASPVTAVVHRQAILTNVANASVEQASEASPVSSPTPSIQQQTVVTDVVNASAIVQKQNAINEAANTLAAVVQASETAASVTAVVQKQTTTDVATAPRTAVSSAASDAAASAAFAASAAKAASAAAVAAVTAVSAADASKAALRASAAAVVAKDAANQAHQASQLAAEHNVAARQVEAREAIVQQQAAIAAAQESAAIAHQEAAIAQAKNPLPVVPMRTTTSWWSMMLDGLSFGVVIKALCMIGNVLVQVSPFPQVKRWAQKGCTGEVDSAPYVAIAFAGYQWCFYGTFAFLLTQRSGFLILVQSNCLGALLGTYYAITFYQNCHHEVALNSLQKYMSAVGSLVIFQTCTLGALPPERSLFLTGLVASFCSFIGAISMLVPVPVVVQKKDSRTISGPLVFANFGSSLVWLICGVMLQDPLVYGPNVIAATSSGICIYLKIKYPSLEFAKLEDGLNEYDGKALAPKAMEDELTSIKVHVPVPMKPTQPFIAPMDAGPCRRPNRDLTRQLDDLQSCGTGGTF